MKQRTFKKKEVLAEMLTLRAQGWTLDDLAFRYDCDKTSVRKACLRNGLPSEVTLLPRPVVIFRRVLLDFDGQRINQGKDYVEYLREAQQRKRQLRVTVRRYII